MKTYVVETSKKTVLVRKYLIQGESRADALTKIEGYIRTGCDIRHMETSRITDCFNEFVDDVWWSTNSDREETP